MNSQNSLNEKDELKTQIMPEETVQDNEIVAEPETVQETIVESPEAVQETVAEPEPEAVQETVVEPEPEAVQEKTEEPVAEEPVAVAETAAPEAADISKPEIIARIKELIEQEVEQVKEEVEGLKQLFYKKSKTETDSQRATYLENGGSEADFIPSPTELETEFKELLGEYKNKKARINADLEKEREDNLLKKNHIIEQMKQLIESKEDVSVNINTFRQLQQEWKNTGPVPPAANNDLWKEYNQYQESFWDLIKINNELREYDFKKNLEAKNKLIETAVALDKEEDVVSAFRQLQKLHDEWHELGPVARDLREDTWNRFKEASTVINRKHQAHFEDIRSLEEANLVSKTALCERIEAIDPAVMKTYKDWDGATKQILELQEEWRTIGFAPRKSNQKIFERYRKACDDFFTAKAEFYKEVKSNLNENLEKKKALCEKAEALKESTDWKSASDEFIKMQKEWKTIGPVQKKYSDDIWKRFISACDYFFEQRTKNVSGQKSEEVQNLEKKKELIEKINAFQKSENASESLTKLRALAAEWNAIGHVPYKEKDKIYKEYRTALDTQFDSLNIDASQRRLESFRSNLKDMSDKGENKLYREREKLVRSYEHLKSEIATYENNIGFLSISSKKGGGMLQEMERKIESLKEECRLLEQKINMIDEKI
ncbi:MAG: DUF349 domain-containing protein [Paludibacteraceae bacterium]